MKSFLDYVNEEKLRGNQNKLDVNNNGKLDKFDFQALRNKKVKKEYVDDQGKLVEKPEEEVVADYKGPDAKNPPGDKKAAPYKAANDSTKSPTVSVEKQGLGELGDKNLKYEPDSKADANGTVVKSWTKTEGFLNKTKNMSASEFTKFMLDECGCGSIQDESLPYITAHTAGKFQPNPPEAIKYVVVLANKNENILENIVHEMKSAGILGKILKSLLEHPEAYDELSMLFGDQNEGMTRCKLFAKSLNKCTNESVSSPMGFEDEMDNLEGEDEEGLEDEENYEDEEGLDDEEDYEDEEGLDDEEDYESLDDEEDYESLDDEEDYEDEGLDDEEDYENLDDEENQSAAHRNLMRAMRGM